MQLERQTDVTHESITSAVSALSATFETALLTVTGNSTLASLAASGSVTFSSLAGGVLTTDSNGLVSTTTVGASNITDDSLNFAQLSDSLVLDASTTIDLDTNSANLTFDSGTLFIDGANNRVGVGTTTPEVALSVVGALNVTATSTTRSNLGLGYAIRNDVATTTQIIAWGDSLTAATTGNTKYTTQLYSKSGLYIENQGAGGETSTQIKTRMLAATSKYSWPTIIWAGRNNYSDPTQVKADIAAMVAALGHTNYLVLSILNGDYSNEYSGQSDYSTIIQLNSDLSTTYGTRYVDVRAYLIANYDSNVAQDVTDYGNDVPPSSLRADGLHLNSTGYGLIAEKINENIETLLGAQEFATSVVTPALLSYMLSTPGTIGGASQGNGYFTNVGIGVATTSALLHLYSGEATTTKLVIENTRGDQSRSLEFWSSDVNNAGSRLAISSIRAYGREGGSGEPYLDFSVSDGSLTTVTTPISRIRILNTGYIGIGDSDYTSQAGAQLDIASTTTANLRLSSWKDILQQGDVVGKLEFFKGDTTGGSGVPAYIQTRAYDANGQYFSMDFAVGETSSLLKALTLDYNGNVGIGNTNPTSKLYVSGSITATSTITGTNIVTNDSVATSTFAASVRIARDNSSMPTSLQIFNGYGSGPRTIDFNSNNSGEVISAQIYSVGREGGGPEPSLDFRVSDGSGAATSPQSVLTLLNTGNVGIGDTGADGLLEISASGGSSDLFLLSSNDSNDGDKFIVKNSGSVGIATTSPAYKLDVYGTVGFTNLTASTGAGSVCMTTAGEVVYNSGSDNCLTSTRDTKHDITELTLTANVEDFIAQLAPVSFIYNNDDTERARYGFIADDALLVNEHLVTYNQEGEVTGLDSNGFFAVIVSAIKDLYGKFARLAESFTSKNITAQDTLCVGKTCITEAELKIFLEESNQSATAIGATYITDNTNTDNSEASSTATSSNETTASSTQEVTVADNHATTADLVITVNETDEVSTDTEDDTSVSTEDAVVEESTSNEEPDVIYENATVTEETSVQETPTNTDEVVTTDS